MYDIRKTFFIAILLTTTGSVWAENSSNVNFPWEKQYDPRVLNRLENVVDDYCRSPVNNALFRVKTGTAELGPNMMKNSDFEQVYDKPEEKKGVPIDWARTPRIKDKGGTIDTIKYEKKDNIYGWYSGRVIGADGYYMKRVSEIEPRKMYLVKAYVKLHHISEVNLERAPSVTLKVKWWGKGWLNGNEYMITTYLTRKDGWHLMELVISPPEDATDAMVFLFINNLKDDTAVLMDNLSVQRIEVSQ